MRTSVRHRDLAVALVVLAAGAVATIVYRQFGGSGARNLVRATSDLDGRLLLAGIAVSFAAMCNRGLMNHAAHRSVGLDPGVGEMIGTSSVGFSAQKIIKSGGLSGLAVFVHRGKRHGHGASHVAGACLLVVAASLIAFGIAMLSAIGSLWWHGRLTGWWLAASLGVVAYASGALGLAVLARRHRGVLFRIWQGVHRLVGRVRRRPRPAPDPQMIDDLFEALATAPARRADLCRMLVYAVAGKGSGVVLLLIATRSAGLSLTVNEALVVYAMALGSSFVSVVPFGVGMVEASTAALLVAGGASGSSAALAVVVFRVLDMWVPLTVGLVAARGTLRRHDLDLVAVAPLASVETIETMHVPALAAAA